MSCPVNNVTQPIDLGEDRAGGGPLEGPWMLVVVLDEFVDPALAVQECHLRTVRRTVLPPVQGVSLTCGFADVGNADDLPGPGTEYLS